MNVKPSVDISWCRRITATTGEVPGAHFTTRQSQRHRLEWPNFHESLRDCQRPGALSYAERTS